MVPTIGRIVHYQSYGTTGGEFLPEPRAAIIAAVHNETSGDCDVVVFHPTRLFFNRVLYSETPKPGHWNWPPRV